MPKPSNNDRSRIIEKKDDKAMSRLMSAINKCANDGIPCNECKIRLTCVEYWDYTVCDMGRELSKERVTRLIQEFSRFQIDKRTLTKE